MLGINFTTVRLSGRYYNNSSRPECVVGVRRENEEMFSICSHMGIEYYKFIYLTEAFLKTFSHIGCRGAITIDMKRGLFKVSGELSTFDEFDRTEATSLMSDLESHLKKFKRSIQGNYRLIFTVIIDFKGVVFDGENDLTPFNELVAGE